MKLVEIILGYLGYLWVMGSAAIIVYVIITIAKITKPNKDTPNKTSTNTRNNEIVKATQIYQTPTRPSPANTNQSYSMKYQKKSLLTRNEWYEYRKLKELADQKNLIICPKVRLLDIIEPRHNERDYMTLLAKIQSKHIDFVICSQEMNVIAVLEIDDNSHYKPERRERDAFVNEILKSVGYKVIRTRSITETTLDVLDKGSLDDLDTLLKVIEKYEQE